ncbi:MAG: 2-C-methyl-D-erythritol 2,4-cyclodiphosphate synthase [Micrococcales bacterium]|nr:2-C-methyl-D-erythritol 2,4-cyclodiphosphate synthase [Micrococcales bacterium]
MTHRTGLGFDAHRFAVDNRPLKLALLTWPGHNGLEGHSDGDVVAHALVDAMATAAGLGDIGELFGQNEPRHRNADSLLFLQQTVTRLSEAGFALVNAAVQLIGNSPVVAPRRIEAQLALSQAVGAPVSLAATTTDAMGFTGRGEGLAALATCLVTRINQDQ